MTLPPHISPSAGPVSMGTGPVRLNIFGRTDVGQVREHNEDNFLVADLTRSSRALHEADRQHTVGPRGTVIGVCDGMGGAAAGEVASQLAVDIIYEKMSSYDAPEHRNEFARRLIESVEAAGLRIFTEAKADRARRGMGTTATIAGLIDDHLFLAQVGDSRGYILRGERLVQVTRDQSLVNQLIEAGQLTEEEAETFEHNNIILQALGTADTVQVDLTYVLLRRGDRLMLCSDGLSGMVRFDEIREVLLHVSEPLDACRVLTDRANQAGGHDNITVIVAQFDGEGLRSSISGDEDLRYRKYPLPERPSQDAIALDNNRSTLRNLELGETPPLPAPVFDTPSTQPPPRLSDHGPSMSKVAHTLLSHELGAAVAVAVAAHAAEAKSQATSHPAPRTWEDARDDSEPVLIPTTNAPVWMVGGVVLGALMLALMAGYYLLR